MMAAVDVLGSLITGGASYISNRDTNATNRDIARDTNNMNRSISREQMGFQDYESSTAYQRSMADMRAAGLNPILAAKNGGASSPSGAGIPAVTGAPAINNMSGVLDSITSVINTAMALKKNSADVANTNANTDLAKATTLQTIPQNVAASKTQQELVKANTKVAAATAPYITTKAKNVGTHTILSQAAIPAAQNASVVEKSYFGKAMAFIDRLTKSLHSSAKSATATMEAFE
jgi:hypothetical protein